MLAYGSFAPWAAGNGIRSFINPAILGTLFEKMPNHIVIVIA